MKKILLFAILAAVMAGCAKKAAETAAVEEETAPVAVVGEWQIAQLQELPLVATDELALPALTINEDGTFHLYAGCNQINGTYAVEGEEITFGEAASTKMMCPDVMEIEDALCQLLRGTLGIVADGEALVLTDEAGATILRLVK